jgi:hypothetical protein
MSFNLMRKWSLIFLSVLRKINPEVFSDSSNLIDYYSYEEYFFNLFQVTQHFRVLFVQKKHFINNDRKIIYMKKKQTFQNLAKYMIEKYKTLKTVRKPYFSHVNRVNSHLHIFSWINLFSK